MKKLAVVALALVIAMSFVGCGLANQLEGTKWEIRETEEEMGIKVSAVFAWEFKADDVFVESLSYEFDLPAEYEGMEDEFASYLPSDSVATGTWSASGDQLTLSGYGTVTAEIDGDKLTVTDADGDSLVFTRAN